MKSHDCQPRKAKLVVALDIQAAQKLNYRKRYRIGYSTVNPSNPKTRQASRVSRHRKKVAAGGAKRVEVTVPFQDAPLVRAIASSLRSGGEDAALIRRTLQPTLVAQRMKTGAELVAFLRASPLTDADLAIERDNSTGRSADLV